MLVAAALVAGMGLQVNVTAKADDLQDAQNKASQQQSQIDAAQAEKDKLASSWKGSCQIWRRPRTDIEKKQEEIVKKF